MKSQWIWNHLGAGYRDKYSAKTMAAEYIMMQWVSYLYIMYICY